MVMETETETLITITELTMVTKTVETLTEITTETRMEETKHSKI